MKILKKVSSTLTNAKFSFRRFPLVMIFAILAALFFSISINQKGLSSDKNIYNILGFMSIGGIFLYALIALFTEGLYHSAKDGEGLKRYRMIVIFLYLASIPFLYILYDLIYEEGGGYFAFENKYVFFGIVLTLMVACSFVSKIFYHRDYVPFVVKILQALITSMVYSTILFLGLVGIIFALIHLFGLELKDTIYGTIFFFSFIPFNVGICLSSFPKTNESLMDYHYPKPIRVLLVYLMMPITIIYLVILFLYFAKILLMRELPEGLIVNLILWFGIVAIFFNFFLSHIKDHRGVNLFRQFFTIIMMPVLAMMFFAIYLRVKEYGLTENRYFVMVGGVWILLSCLYYMFYRKNSNIVIPILLSILILVSTTGPLSAYNLSARSQNHQFLKILEKNSMLNGNQIIAKSEIPRADKKNLTGIVSYMIKNHRKHELSYLPKGFYMSESGMRDVFGFEPYYGNERDDVVYYTDQNLSIDISGYKKMIRVDSLRYDSEEKSEFGAYQIYRKGPHVIIDYAQDDQSFELTDINVRDLEDKLRTLKKAVSIINPEDLAIKGESGGINYKIIFTDINLYEDYLNTGSYSLSFYLLTDREE